MNTIKLHMTLKKETLGTYVYSSGSASPVPSLYVRRDFLPTPPPKSITITIEES